MFVTLQQFHDDFRIKNGQFPNETTLNRGLMRLKREIRELESMLKCVLGSSIEPWNESKVYEIDEYVSYNGLIYKSNLDSNVAMNPQTSEFWSLQNIQSLSEKNQAFKHLEATSDGIQRRYELPFDIDATPAVFIDGILWSTDNFTWSSTYIELSHPAPQDSKVTVIAGITYETVAVQPKHVFTASENQWHFEVPFKLAAPAVFVNGLYQTQGFTFGSGFVDFDDPLPEGTQVCIVNGVQGGVSLYTREEIDELLKLYCKLSETYTKAQVDSALSNTTNTILTHPSLAKTEETYSKAEVNTIFNSIDVSDQVAAGLNGKADKATTLQGYGITDAYDRGTVDLLLQAKLSESDFNAENILNRIRNAEGENTGLNADTIKGIKPEQLMRRDIADRIKDKFGVIGETQKVEIPSNGGAKFVKSLNAYNEISYNYLDELNSTGAVVFVEGDFKGSWWDSIYNFGVAEPELYNWVVEVYPNFVGNQFDFIPKGYGDGFKYTGWKENGNTSAFHYGYIVDSTVKLYSWIKLSNGTFVEGLAHYVLKGYRKNISAKFVRNKGDAPIPPVSFTWSPESQSMIVKDIDIPTVDTPKPAQDNALTLLTDVTHENESTNVYKSSVAKHHTLQASHAEYIDESDFWIRVRGGVPCQDLTVSIENGSVMNEVTKFNELGECLIKIRGTLPLTVPPKVTVKSKRCKTLKITLKIKPTESQDVSMSS